MARRELICCLGVALLLRVAACWYFQSHLTTDLDAYAGIAQAVANGDGYSTPGTTEPTAYRPPLFSLLLAATMNLVDIAWSVSLWQVVLGVATVGLTWRLACDLGLGRSAFLAALLVAVDPILLFYGTYPMTEVCCACLTTAWCCLVVRSRRLAETATSSTIATTNLLTGFVFGLAVLCRPTLWAAGALYCCMVMAPTICFRRVSSASRLIALFTAFVGIAVAVTPWVIRNQMVFGTPIMTTTHGGYTLLLANNPTFYDEVVEQPWGVVWSGTSLAEWQQSLEAEMHDENIAGEVERDRWMSRRARQFIWEHPRTFIKASVKRWLWFWNPIPLETNNTSLAGIRWAIGCYYGIVFLMMLAGSYLVFADNSIGTGRTFGDERFSKLWGVVFVTILGFAGTHLVYWSNMRMRGPIVPLISLLAAAAIGSIAARFSRAKTEVGEPT